MEDVYSPSHVIHRKSHLKCPLHTRTQETFHRRLLHFSHSSQETAGSFLCFNSPDDGRGSISSWLELRMRARARKPSLALLRWLCSWIKAGLSGSELPKDLTAAGLSEMVNKDLCEEATVATGHHHTIKIKAKARVRLLGGHRNLPGFSPMKLDQWYDLSCFIYRIWTEGSISQNCWEEKKINTCKECSLCPGLVA